MCSFDLSCLVSFLFFIFSYLFKGLFLVYCVKDPFLKPLMTEFLQVYWSPSVPLSLLLLHIDVTNIINFLSFGFFFGLVLRYRLLWYRLSYRGTVPRSLCPYPSMMSRFLTLTHLIGVKCRVRKGILNLQKLSQVSRFNQCSLSKTIALITESSL